MILKIFASGGACLVHAEVHRRPVNTFPKGYGAYSDMEYWIQQSLSVFAFIDGTMHTMKLYEPTASSGVDRLVATIPVANLAAMGMVGQLHLRAGQTFKLHHLPVLKRWMPEAVPETLRAPAPAAPQYRTPRAQRTEQCPCGSHYSVCTTHYDWLTVD